MLGGINQPLGQIGQNQQASTNVAKEVQNLSREIGDLKTDLNNLSNELLGGQSTSGTKQQSKTEQQGNMVGNKPKQDAAKTHDVIPNQAIAVAADEEDKKLQKKRKAMDLDEKLNMLMELEETMDGAVLDNPEHQAVVEQFFSNMSQIRNLRGRLRGLEEKERRLLTQLELMEDKDPHSVPAPSADHQIQQPVQGASQEGPQDETQVERSSNDAPHVQRPSNLPPHIQLTQLDQNSQTPRDGD